MIILMQIAKKIKNIAASETGEMQKRVLELESQGQRIIKLHIGEPDFATPPNIVEAIKSAFNKGLTKYGDSRGLKELRKAVCQKMKREQNLVFDPESEIIITSGAKQALYEAFQAVFDPGDRVLVFLPAWVSYAAQLKLAGAKPVFFDLTNYNFRLTAEALAEIKNIIPYNKIRAIILNSPNNPTGAVYSAEELELLADIALENDIAIITDEIYEKIAFDGLICRSIAAVEPKIKNNTVIVNGVSKAYAMTGLRIGWVIANPKIISAAAKIHSAIQTHPSLPEQYGALEALTGPQDFVEKSRRTFEERKTYMSKMLKEMNIDFIMPQGAFYIFIDISPFLNKKIVETIINTSADFSKFLLEKEKVSTVAGSAFGKEGWLRISFAADTENIEEGMKRIKNFLEKLK